VSFSIIIPSKNISNLQACVACICAAHETARIIIVDDFAFDATATFLQDVGDKPEQLSECTWIKGVKPFVFARNINLGIAAAGDDDVILLNDDALLKTHLGFSWLAASANDSPEYGILAAAVDGACGCEEQKVQPGTRVRPVKHHTVVFIAVYIRREVLTAMMSTPGRVAHANTWWLDERYEGYGYDDDDMCERVRQLGLKLGVFDGCIVDHGSLPSSYRGTGSASSTDLAPNRARFIEKWGFAPGQINRPPLRSGPGS
jgi:glycosyltransferase involved in cell wall biosynthesis